MLWLACPKRIHLVDLSGIYNFQLLKSCYFKLLFSLLVLKGNFHYWKYVCVSILGLKQMDVEVWSISQSSTGDQ